MPRRAFTVVEIMVAVTALAVISSIAIPAYAGSRSHAQEEASRHNRAALDRAKLLWAMDHGKTDRDAVLFRDLVPEYVGDVPVCRGGGHYELNGLDGKTTCTAHVR